MTALELASIVDDLRGTCKSLEDVVDPASLTLADHYTISNEIFCCDTCGWWCEVSEESTTEPGSCLDCSEEGMED